MEEKKTIKISITTLFLILAIVAIIVMGVFILKINKQQEEQIESNKELKEEINKLKTDNNVENNTNNEIENNTTNNSTTESLANTASFTDSEVKKSLEEYLNLIGYKHGSKLSILVPLNLMNEESIANLEESGEAEVNTGVKYDKFKNQILNYISNNCFDNTFNDDYINKNGTLYVKNEDGSGDSYNVKNISKISDNSYKAEIENDAYDEVITDTINFKITNNSNGKCVIDECDKK